jgi:hypothetical protein
LSSTVFYIAAFSSALPFHMYLYLKKRMIVDLLVYHLATEGLYLYAQYNGKQPYLDARNLYRMPLPVCKWAGYTFILSVFHPRLTHYRKLIERKIVVVVFGQYAVAKPFCCSGFANLAVRDLQSRTKVPADLQSASGQADERGLQIPNVNTSGLQIRKSATNDQNRPEASPIPAATTPCPPISRTYSTRRSIK